MWTKIKGGAKAVVQAVMVPVYFVKEVLVTLMLVFVVLPVYLYAMAAGAWAKLTTKEADIEASSLQNRNRAENAAPTVH